MSIYGFDSSQSIMMENTVRTMKDGVALFVIDTTGAIMAGNYHRRLRTSAGVCDSTVSFDSIKNALPAIFRTSDGRKSVKFITQSSPHKEHTIDIQRYLGLVHGTIRPISLHSELITLPDRINVFSSAQLNKDLYIWLAIFYASCQPHQLHGLDDPLLVDLYFIRQAYHTALRAQIFYRDFAKRYQALAEATVTLREDCDLPPLEKEVEDLIQSLLGNQSSEIKTGHAFYDYVVHGIPLPCKLKSPPHYAPAQALPLWGEVHYCKPDIYFDHDQTPLRNQHTCISK